MNKFLTFLKWGVTVKYVPLIFLFLLGVLSCLWYLGVAKRVKIQNTQIHEIKMHFNKEELSYFYQTVFGEEDGSCDYIMSKWNKSVMTLGIFGHPTPSDKMFLKFSVQELNKILKGTRIEVLEKPETGSDPDISVLFLTFDEYTAKNPDLTEEDRYSLGGCVKIKRSFATRDIIKSTIFIDTDLINTTRRKHTILEEVVQSLGPTRDSYTYKNSIFFEGESNDTLLSEMDKKVVELLYNFELKSGIDKYYFKRTFLIGG